MISYTVEKRHSDKKNKDYCCVVMHIGPIDKVLFFITEDQYNLYVATTQK